MLPQSIQNLTTQLSKLPDIGPRAATRLVFYLINQNQEELEQLSVLIKNLKKEVHLCPQCFNIAENNQLCPICQDTKKDKEIICVVENVLNIAPIERTGHYHGHYHVLGGLISPTDGISPEKLTIKELIEKAKKGKSEIKEIIFALSPTTEGDTTAFYIERLLSPLKIKTSRLARGLSVGSDLEYIDENTLSNALRGRK